MNPYAQVLGETRPPEVLRAPIADSLSQQVMGEAGGRSQCGVRSPRQKLVALRAEPSCQPSGQSLIS